MQRSAIWPGSWTCRFLAATALGVSALSTPAAAQDRAIAIDLSARTLRDAIAELSSEANVSIGTAGILPLVAVDPVRGRMTVSQALKALLADTDLVARQVGAAAWRIERGPRRRPPGSDEEARGTPASPPPEPIIVTGGKLRVTLQDAPYSVQVFMPQGQGGRPAALGSADVANAVEGLAVSRQGPGQNRLFLRGIADSPFGGRGQETVAILLDDARVTVTAPDPDIRLVDVDRVEVLKGPQGSLYGSGALGGIYRVVVNRPDAAVLSFAGGASVTHAGDGDRGASGSLIANVPLVPDALALRLVAYGESAPGWVDTGERADSNGTKAAGVRAGLGLTPGGGWRADLTGFGQWLNTKDSRYVYAPHARIRPAQIPEPHDNDLLHGALRIVREGDGGPDILLATGFTHHSVDERFDATIGLETVPAARVLSFDDTYRVWDNELRVTRNDGPIRWVAGLSYLEAHQRSSRTVETAGDGEIALERVERMSSETGLFGQVSAIVAHDLELTLGGRLFRSVLADRLIASEEEGEIEHGRSGFTPAAGLAWRPGADRVLYLRFGSALRQGGTALDSNGAVTELDGDDLATVSAGWRETVGPISLDLSAYWSWWSSLQSDVLRANGLVETENAGDASIKGVELAAEARLPDGWSLDAGAMVQSARLTRNTSGQDLDDRRLPIVPAWTLRAAIGKTWSIRSWDVTARLRAHYTGPARLSFDPLLDRRMGEVFESDAGVSAIQGPWTIAFDVRNVLDLTANVLAYGNPLRVPDTRQYTPQEPLMAAFTVSFAR